jgi:hypothetical protein
MENSVDYERASKTADLCRLPLMGSKRNTFGLGARNKM